MMASLQTAQSRAFYPASTGSVHSVVFPLQRPRCLSRSCRVQQIYRPRRTDLAVRALGPDSSSVQAQPGLSPELKDALEKFINSHKVVLFMKGTKQFPQCGFSNTCVQILNTLNAPYETVNILEDERLRSGMKEFSQWPTFPQVYIDGEFYGGCDIMIEAYTNGELVETLEAAVNS
ncbi:glutaredoxin [Coccomyxa subellipsoidea C-169]|uniref:Glutaredoxin n=1 Tax=Coccomyxa subellipsoidea (strain C-169) TaxID=574566 RepID=I0YKR7_COCSC|nr:glutaredoxin [Coccomyxa subellipsoidea C-169]EIE18986.1 glutaredoxin [Coccomyxa subellipsoidea C-169]|eukprot:XP_005643530.1 glutaredoxin [Coccomyxa subellipsoidea C-169]